MLAKRLLIGLSLLAAVAVFAMMWVRSPPANNVVQEFPTDRSLTTLEMFERGIVRHVLETRFDGGHPVVEIRRGNTAEIPFTVIHHSHAWWEPVTVKEFRNKFANYSPSGQEIVITSLSYLPGSVFLWGDASEPALMKVSIPEDMSDEMLNRTVIIMASFTFETWYDYEVSKMPGYIKVKIVS